MALLWHLSSLTWEEASLSVRGEAPEYMLGPGRLQMKRQETHPRLPAPALHIRVLAGAGAGRGAVEELGVSISKPLLASLPVGPSAHLPKARPLLGPGERRWLKCLISSGFHPLPPSHPDAKEIRNNCQRSQSSPHLHEAKVKIEHFYQLIAQRHRPCLKMSCRLPGCAPRRLGFCRMEISAGDRRLLKPP